MHPQAFYWNRFHSSWRWLNDQSVVLSFSDQGMEGLRVQLRVLVVVASLVLRRIWTWKEPAKAGMFTVP